MRDNGAQKGRAFMRLNRIANGEDMNDNKCCEYLRKLEATAEGSPRVLLGTELKQRRKDYCIVRQV